MSQNGITVGTSALPRGAPAVNRTAQAIEAAVAELLSDSAQAALAERQMNAK